MMPRHPKVTEVRKMSRQSVSPASAPSPMSSDTNAYFRRCGFSKGVALGTWTEGSRFRLVITLNPWA